MADRIWSFYTKKLGAFLDSKIHAVKLVGCVWPGSMAGSSGSYRLHVRPKLDSGGRMFVIVGHLAMFASAKHSAATVHFEAGHCKRYEPKDPAIDPGQTQLQVWLSGGDFRI